MKSLRIGITHGDINGIGLELIVKSLSDPLILDLFTPIVFSDADCISETVKSIRQQQDQQQGQQQGQTQGQQREEYPPLQLEQVSSAKEAQEGKINLVNVCRQSPHIAWGQQTEEALQAEADSLNAALEAYRAGDIDLMVCAPGKLDNDIDSHSLSDFIQQALGAQNMDSDWIVNGHRRILKLSPIRFSTELGEGIAIETFCNNLKAVYNQLRQDIGDIRPRIALVSANSSLSQHIHDLQEQGITVFGPFNAQTFVSGGLQEHYDGVLFLDEEDARHQLISALDASQTFGYVAGLPLILTYPLVGVSYQIAGQGQADATSMRNALYAAIDTYRNRTAYETATRKPLERQWNPKGKDDYKLDLTKDE